MTAEAEEGEGDKGFGGLEPERDSGDQADLLNWRRDVRWNQDCEELGLDRLTPHDLRRTFGSLARLAGADLKYIQKARGHSAITVTAEIYAHLFDSELDQVSDALDALTEGFGDAMYVQNMSTEPDPGSDRAP